jgi:hypothetical protein
MKDEDKEDGGGKEGEGRGRREKRQVTRSRACDDVAADEIFEIIGTEMQNRGQSHGVDGGLPEHMACKRA